ncbi:Uncharacterized protein FWK35_00032975 [Aphis craccivora]|uniref:Uncharacterized protein n=1 Tax=Aphis craccivora TaxID=307492 RepID=A0A6G0VS59_APHCR|nr:Uncharacterized protein FWK35_00032975 [Aphis craccivora]
MDYNQNTLTIPEQTSLKEIILPPRKTNKTYYDKSLNKIELHVGPYDVLLVHDNENITIQKGRSEYRIHKNNVKRIKQHIFLKELSAVIGRKQHYSTALYPDEIPNCLLIHIDLANRNLLQTFSAEEILNMTRRLEH